MRHFENLNWDDIDIIEFRLTLEEDYNEDDEETEYIVIYDITATDKYGNSTYIDGTYDDMIEHYNVPIDIMNIIMNVFKKKGENYNETYYIGDLLYERWANCDDIYEAAKHLFDTSNEYIAAHGFITQDGMFIYMEEGTDHNNITSLKNIDSKFDFIEMGNISFYEDSIRVGKQLTYPQERALSMIIRHYSDSKIYLALLNGPKGDKSVCYHSPDYRRVLSDIDNYYNDGIVPFGDGF